MDDKIDRFHLGKFSTSRLPNSTISYIKLTDEFYLITNLVYEIINDEAVPTGDTEEFLLLINPSTKQILAQGEIIKEKRQLEQFIVDSRYRRSGNGERFIRFVIQEFNINNISVDVNNKRAINLYTKCGFMIKNKYREGNHELYKMVLNSNTSNLATTLESYLL